MPTDPDPKQDRLGRKELLSFAVGGLPLNLGVESLKQLAYPVYNILLGVSPAWIGLILMIARLFDALRPSSHSFITFEDFELIRKDPCYTIIKNFIQRPDCASSPVEDLSLNEDGPTFSWSNCASDFSKSLYTASVLGQAIEIDILQARDRLKDLIREGILNAPPN